MKYAYIFGSNAFIVPTNILSYTDNDQTVEFLRINSVYHDTNGESSLVINTNLRDIEGRLLNLTDNKADNAFGFTINTGRDRVLVTGPNGQSVLDVHQLDDESAMALEHNIIAELEVHSPIAVIRVRGDFMLGRMHVDIDNEKIFIVNDSFANSVLTGHAGLTITASGVKL